MTTTILLARHGETDWNLERRVQGHSDRPLNQTGRAQARALADQLDGEQLDAVYSSDLSRARETALIVGERKRLPVTALPGLREKNFGSWEGSTDEEILLRFPHARRGEWGDGETSEELARRVVEALALIAAAHPDGRVLVVSHGGPLRAVLRHSASDHAVSIGNCHIIRIAVENGSMRQVD